MNENYNFEPTLE